MSHDDDDDDVLLIEDETDNDRDDAEVSLHSRRTPAFSNRIRLSFCEPPNKAHNKKSGQSYLTTDELPDLDADSCNEPPVKKPAEKRSNEQSYTKLINLANQNGVILKPCSVLLVRCDEKPHGSNQSQISPSRCDKRRCWSLQNDKNLSKSTIPESVENNHNNTVCQKKADIKRKSHSTEEQKAVKIPKDTTKNDCDKQTTEESYPPPVTFCETLVCNAPTVSRKRISTESQAVSSPIEHNTPLAIFPQPSPIRKNLPTSRISYHRQAFSSPCRANVIEKTVQRQSAPVTPSEIQYLSGDQETEESVQIFHRTIKRVRKPDFDYCTEDSNSQSFLNQLMNLERNIIFGQYWHVYIPTIQSDKLKKCFTEYHEAFIEAALEQEENPVREALSLLKDFQSKRCPTSKTISSIIASWKKNPTLDEEEDSEIVCVLAQVFESYPEVAKAYVDRTLMSLVSRNVVQQTESSIIMAALELDFFTRTLCDSFSVRRSLIYSSLSIWNNRDSVLGITQIIKANIKACLELPDTVTASKLSKHSESEKVPKIKRLTIKRMLDKVANERLLEDEAASSKLHNVSQSKVSSNNPHRSQVKNDNKVPETLNTQNLAMQCLGKRSLHEISDKLSMIAESQLPPEMHEQIVQKCLKSDNNQRLSTGDYETCAKRSIDNLNDNTPFLKTGGDSCEIKGITSLSQRVVCSEKETNVDSSTCVPVLEKITQEFSQREVDTVSSATILEDETNKKENNIKVCEQQNKLHCVSQTPALWRGYKLELIEKHLCSLASAMVTNIYFYQRLLALVMESNISQKEVITLQLADLLIQVYHSVRDIHGRQLLLGSVASPLLTATLAKRLLQQQGYLEDSGPAWSEQNWQLSFRDEVEFLKRFTPMQQEEFSMLFYYALWGLLETKKHNLQKKRSDCLLNFGLSSETMPRQIQQCTAHVICMAEDKLSAQIGHVTQLFLNLTNCLFQTGIL